MDSKTLYKKALALRPTERIELIEKLTQSLDKPDKTIETVWAKEAEKRYQALSEGKVNTVPLDDLIKRYR